MWTDSFDLGDYALQPGKSCDGCAMCCFLPAIDALSKPPGTWCSRCTTRRACDDHENRPDECRAFFCHYLVDPDIGDEWKPAKSKLLLVLGSDGRRLTIFVDPNRPDAWRREPFYGQIKQWASASIAAGAQVVIDVKGRKTLILPAKDVEFGLVRPDEEIVTTLERGPGGLIADAYLRKRAAS